MSHEAQDDLRLFLATFDAAGLGEGDINAGANTLAAMLVTLANLARPGSGIAAPGGRPVPVGCDLLASGPLATSLILDGVVAPVGRCQDTLLAQLARLGEDDAAEAGRKDRNLPRRWALSEGSKASPGEHALFGLMTRDSDMGPLTGSDEDGWVEAVTHAPSQRPGDLLRRPRCFIAAPTPRSLEGQLADAHLGQALVVIGLNRATDAAGFGGICPALMDGLLPGGPCGGTVRGRLLVADPGGVLPGATAAPGGKAGWLARLLPLVGCGAAPDFPPPPAAGDNIVRLPNLSARFEHAVRLLFANRLNGGEPRPVVYECDLSELQARWMSFLADIERGLPGITGGARRLPASLLFGLRRLVGAARAPGGFKYYRDGVEAFARLLVCRAANAHTAMLRAAELAERQWQIERVYYKLSRGRAVTRTIYRDLRIPAAVCHAILRWLEEAAIALHDDGQWELAQGAQLDFDRCPVPLLEA